MNPSDAGFQDRYVVQEVIKEMAKSRPIDAKGKRAFKGLNCYFLVHCDSDYTPVGSSLSCKESAASFPSPDTIVNEL
jgi:hypothetical protein